MLDPLIGTIVSRYVLLNKFYWDFSNNLKKTLQKKIIAKVSKLRDYVCTPSNDHKFESAVHQAMSMGKVVTSQSVFCFVMEIDNLLGWVMGYKEAFSELVHIDPHFKFINFTKKDRDDTTLMYSGWQVLHDLGKEISNLLDPEYENADVNF